MVIRQRVRGPDGPRTASNPTSAAKGDFATRWPLREIYATTVGVVGTVLALPSLIHMSRIGTIIVCDRSRVACHYLHPAASAA
jgi:hypothetical protein